jgi:outer membrane receptor protein involved in Fe transport
VVTGSRIRQAPTDGVQPLTNISREEIDISGAVSIGQLLQELPGQGSGINTTFNNGGDGSTRFDFRNLTAERTLVLINGRRYVNGGEGADSSVDIDSIPTAMVERIEILKDGASAVYGSDAIAGVVNVITRKDTEGLELKVQTGEYMDDGGQRKTASLVYGVNSDRGNTTFGMSITTRGALSNADRAETAARPASGGSSGTPQGRFAYGGIVPDGNGGFFSNWTAKEGTAVTSLNDFREWTSPDDRYNYNPENYIETPQERRNVFIQGNYDLRDDLRLTFDAMYQNRSSDQLLAPTPLFWGFDPEEGISKTNIYNYTGYELCSTADATCTDANGNAGVKGWLGRRMLEAGNRNFIQDIDTLRASITLEGDINENWTWDVFGSWARNSGSIVDHGLLNMERIGRALGPDADCTGAADGCVPLNLFGGQGSDSAYLGDGLWSGSGSITQEMLDYISFVAHNTGGNEITNLAAGITGKLGELPAGEIGFAAGYEYREEEGFVSPDALVVSGVTSGNASDPTSGGFSSNEFFAEVSVPLLADVPMVEMLEFSGAVRYSDYSTFGTTTKGKYGLKWNVTEDLIFRTNFSEGFRAPPIANLFGGQFDSFPDLNDPCDVNAPNFTGTGNTQSAACAAVGVADGFTQPNTQIRITRGANPNLQPEESESFTFGVVYAPSFIEGLTLYLDAFDIEIVDTIDSIGAQNILNDCYSGANTGYCQMIDRVPGGLISDLRDLAANVGKIETSGVDFTLTFDDHQTSFGNFRYSLDMSYTDKYDLTQADGKVEEWAGVVDGSGRRNYTKIRAKALLGWQMNQWDATWDVQYFHGTESVPNDPGGIAADGTSYAGDDRTDMDATLYHDLQVSYSFDQYDARLTVGVDNIFDTDPPKTEDTFANDFDPSYRTWGSRFMYFRASVSL